MRIPTAIKRVARPWAGLFIFLALLAIFIAVDGRIKGAVFPGYVPDNAIWTLAARNLPLAWERASVAEYLAALRDDLRPELNDLTLAIYRVTGIRLTPLRLRVWLGNSFAGAISGDGAGICVKPGLLLRARLALARSPRLQDGTYVFGDYYYAWRGGFLIAATSPAYVQNALRSTPLRMEYGPVETGLTIQHRAEPHFLVKLTPSGQLRIDGYINADISSRQGPMELAGLGDNVAVVAASTPQDVSTILNFCGQLAKCAFPRMSDALAAFGRPVLDAWSVSPPPKNWARGITETAAFLADVEIDHDLPLPCGGLVMRTNGQYGAHPLEALAGRHALPYEWRGTPGQIVPWLGEKVSLCLARWGKDWLVTTKEPLMAKIIGQYPQESTAGDAYIAIDIERAARKAEALIRKAGDMELIPWMNGQDAVSAYGARLKALGSLGRLQLTFIKDYEGGTAFRGECIRK